MAALICFALLLSTTVVVSADAGVTLERTIDFWLRQEFKDSTLSPRQQKEELRWFARASKPFRGMTIYIVSERIDTHWYEATTLVKAFEDITGIKVVHELTGEDDVIKKFMTQVQTGENLYDAYITDSDIIGYHYRSNYVVPLTDFIKDEGRDVTLPTLALDDFIGIDFTSAPDGKLYQLPDQQFASLYWYRHDWFSRKKLREQFRGIYGYELGVPVNWSAYEDIADFFSNHVKEIDGKRVYGHMDYGRTDPSLGWRISDAWLAMAGVGDKGLPNGVPVDEWGIRIENCKPVGASVERGGALNSPAAVYAIKKYVEWLEKYAPPYAKKMNFTEAGGVVGQGHIAQQVFWYTAFSRALTAPDLPVMNADGTPKWRMAPSPHGAYWEEGMKLGYQDVGAWTFLKSTSLKRRKAAWLFAQFSVSKTVSLKKTLVGLTPIRKSDIESAVLGKRAPYLGGLVEFYRSPARTYWSPTGTNVPDYIALSKLWWKHVSKAVEGGEPVEFVMQGLAKDMDTHLLKISRYPDFKCKPLLNKLMPKTHWLTQKGAPKTRLNNEKPQGRTLPYKKSIAVWKEL